MKTSVKREIDPIVLSQEDVSEILSDKLTPEQAEKWVPFLFDFLKIDSINEVHQRNCEYRGAEFAKQILADRLIDVRYVVEGREHLEELPTGAFLTISNHPFGGLDGIILLDLIGHYRPDYKLMVNNFLNRIGAMQDSFIPVLPQKKHRKDEYNPNENLTGLLRVMELLGEGTPVGLFPAGGIARWSWKHFAIKEQAWKKRSIKLIKTANVPVLPIFFEGNNSFYYHLLGIFNLKFQVAHIPSEVFNKQGKTFRVHIRPLISPDAWNDEMPLADLTRFFYNQTVVSP